jgi:hypothetical protein
MYMKIQNLNSETLLILNILNKEYYIYVYMYVCVCVYIYTYIDIDM